MTTTIKLSNETKERLEKLDLSEKGKTFDTILNDLMTYYENRKKQYDKDYKEWKKSFVKHKKAYDRYEKEKEMWDSLLKWAKKQGFKP